MIRNNIVLFIHHHPAILFDISHVFHELLCELLTLDHKHELRIHIGAAKIEVIGAYSAQIIVNYQRFSMGGKSSVIFIKADTGGNHIFL